MINIHDIPFLSGAFLLFTNGKDPRKDLVYILAGAMILLIILEAGGYRLGMAGQALIAAFSTLVGYFVRSKEEELKQKI